MRVRHNLQHCIEIKNTMRSSTTPNYQETIGFSNEFVCGKTLGGFGSTKCHFNFPVDIKVDNNLMYIADAGNKRIQVLDLNGNYQYQIKTPNTPDFFAIDYYKGGEEILVGCREDYKIYRYEKKENGQLLQVIGQGYGTGENQFYFDGGSMVVDVKSGNIYISDFGNCRLMIYSNSGQLLQKVTDLSRPQAVDFNSKGQLVVVEHNNNRIKTLDLQGNTISVIQHETYTNYPWGHYIKIYK